MATGRRRAWKTVAVLVALAAVFIVLGSRVDPAGVEIGDALQQVSTGADAAARHTEPVAYEDADLTVVASYVAWDGQLQGDVAPRHRELWSLAAAVLPPEQLRRIRQLNVVTDGPNGTLGMVHRSGVAADQWVLSLDEAENDGVLDETLVHELAHLLTLRRDDLDARADECHGTRIAIGCATAGSALAEWADEFWVDPLGPARYRTDEFVSEYAASAVHEDLAETFLAYVLEEPPRSPSVAAKLAFFDDHPDLAATAAAVRARLATPASRAGS
jgi:hypothetical protein